MDITTIDAVSFATRVGNIAAAELYSLLDTETGDYFGPTDNWFNPTLRMPEGDAHPNVYAEYMKGLGDQVAELGNYVCLQLVDQGERLYRWGGSKGLVPLADWALLDVAGKQAFEAFVDTVRHTYLGLSVAQQAQVNARAALGVRPPAPPKREDTIFEQEESIFTLRPEAIAAAPLQARLQRETEAATRTAEEERYYQDWDDALIENAERKRASRRKPPAPISAGETVVAPPTNRGGRGRKKQPAA